MGFLDLFKGPKKKKRASGARSAPLKKAGGRRTGSDLKTDSEIAKWKAAGIKRVELLGAPDSCKYCLSLAGRKFPIGRAPMPPHRECTHKQGCRCCATPVLD